MDTERAAGLRYLEPAETEVGGATCEGMTVRTASRVLGQLRGFIVDPLARRLQYVVVQTSDWLGRVLVLPMTAARVDLQMRELELLDERVVAARRPFRRGAYLPFSDDDRVAAIFRRSDAA